MPNPIFTEKDLELLFSRKSKAIRKKKAKTALFYFIAPFIFAIILYFGLNYNSIANNLSYWLQFDYLAIETQTNSNQNNTNGASIIIPKPVDKYPKPEMPEIANNSINIPAINVTAPIFWDIKNEPKIVNSTLPNGVIQIAGTAHPGERGNVFITGHSSNYPWVKGEYNSIFALLNKLVAGDLLQVKQSEKLYAYKVTEIKVVQPDDVSVMHPTKEPVLTLMTCTPVGTSLRRLIIISKQVYPDPADNIDSVAATNFGGTLAK